MENHTFENEKSSKTLILKLKDSQCNRVLTPPPSVTYYTGKQFRNYDMAPKVLGLRVWKKLDKVWREIFCVTSVTLINLVLDKSVWIFFKKLPKLYNKILDESSYWSIST